ncbi:MULTISPECIES: hypothetical protein [Bacillus cereus group]|uniref:Phage gp6-like head-tail connector protein n=1 Tax=Bacillus paranthracis TaxID=2026186 RepID=A0A9X8X592_9BACI|nr:MULTISPECIES: hypothetical protein [Bacillus cereus group]ONG78488.1 hypothetical protein BKK41_22805 [Bacillus cereus]MDR4163784.1 hypothetical protein [Bacillus paranthracis]MDX6048375.1 hypothetical protein [Bacillus paranthracis]SME05860.1 hypothetical protein BACERE00221_02350 [Bacillus paranthracis]HDR7769248.1 hypothetical protein [Bacillus paranthracis]
MENNQSEVTLVSPFDLLEDVKHALAITWTEEDNNIIKLIDRSVYYINDLVGAELDLTVNLVARELVINRIRYEYNNALDQFESNFFQPLSRLTLQVAIDERKVSDGTGTT